MYYTSSADVADLIDHLSHDLDASRGRIDILPTPLNAQSSSHTSYFPSGISEQSSFNGQFEDAPSPKQRPASPTITSKTSASVPAAGFSPRRQLFVRQGLNTGSPGSAHFASSGSVGKSVEDRLQALLDRLQDGGPTPIRIT